MPDEQQSWVIIYMPLILGQVIGLGGLHNIWPRKYGSFEKYVKSL